MGDPVTVVVEHPDIAVGLEGVSCDYHYPSIEMVQIVDGRAKRPRGMRMRDSYYAKVHWKHEPWEI